MTWLNRRVGGDPAGHLLQRLARLHLDHREPVGHGGGFTDDTAELRHQPEPHGDARGDNRQQDRGDRCDRPAPVRGA